MTKLREMVQRVDPLDGRAMREARLRQGVLTKPPGSLGVLEELSIRIAGIKGTSSPRIEKKVIVIMVGDHGVVAEGVSLYPPVVTSQMVYNFLRGGAAINVLGRHVGARVVVVDMGVAIDLEEWPGLMAKKIAAGTKNIARGPAMSREQAFRSIEIGIEVEEELAKGGMDILATGDMGIGNTTPSTAILSAFTGAPVTAVTGRGTGLNDRQLQNKVRVIEEALSVNVPNAKDPIDVLAKVGGFEIGGIAGMIIGAAANHLPVIIDGFISGAGALLAVKLQPRVREYLIAAHISAEMGHGVMLEEMGLFPLLDLGLCLGEGTGAALGISLVEAAAKILNEMATFNEADVSQAKG
ncbi:MAG: nicotinate-nucleotide--dimethylbenzimidazole phosphoribosyltransferase [Anaerolineae bacterium]